MEPMMFPAAINCMTDDVTAAASSVSRVEDFSSLNSALQPAVSVSSSHQPQQIIKKKRNLPGNPDPDAEVIALSPKTLLATNRFICEICNKGFQRDQNLQLHRRGHNLPWKLKQRNSKEINKKRAYVCPEPTCVHHHPSRALGDLTGIKKHFSRKHGEKKWMCEKCSKIYAVQSDWKAHTKTCGTREYKCHCGTLFSRKDSFITHRAFCDALAEESARLSANSIFNENITARRPPPPPPPPPPPFFSFTTQQHQQFENPTSLSPMYDHNPWNASHIQNPNPSTLVKPEAIHFPISTPCNNFPDHPPPTPHKSYLGPSSFHVQNLLQSSVPQLSATALLQRASSLGAHSVGHVSSTLSPLDMRNISHMTSGNTSVPPVYGTWQENSDRLTRDFLGLTGEQCVGTTGVGMGNGGNVDLNVNVNMRGVLSFTGRVEFPAYERDLSASAPNHHQTFGYVDPNAPATWRNC